MNPSSEKRLKRLKNKKIHNDGFKNDLQKRLIIKSKKSKKSKNNYDDE